MLSGLKVNRHLRRVFIPLLRVLRRAWDVPLRSASFSPLLDTTSFFGCRRDSNFPAFQAAPRSARAKLVVGLGPQHARHLEGSRIKVLFSSTLVFDIDSIYSGCCEDKQGPVMRTQGELQVEPSYAGSCSAS